MYKNIAEIAMKQPSFTSTVLKATAVHTVTYFIIGLLSFLFLDYTTKYADPAVAALYRQMDDPMIAAGPLFQVLRGFLFGIAFYAARDAFFARPRGWLNLWLVLLVVGVFAPFGAAPGSVEGFVYSRLPAWFHILTLPELIVQSFLLAWLTHYWVNHPEKTWLRWSFGTAAGIVILLAFLGVLAALGVLPQAG
jgi:hypothetical protein